MIGSIRERLNYANVVATIALFLALGGSAFAVTKLPRKSVGTAQLKRGAVQKKNLGREVVGRNKIGRGAVNNAKISRGAVNAAKLANGSVTRFKISPNAVDASRLAAGAVGPDAIQAGAVGAAALAAGAVGGDSLANGSVSRAKISEGSLPLLATLRSGQTLRGSFALGGDTARTVGAQSFQFPMRFSPAVPPANVIDVVGGAPAYTAACPGIAGGNQQTPNAAADQLCLYITAKENLNSLTVPAPTLSRLGFGLEAQFADATGGNVSGLWAATAR